MLKLTKSERAVLRKFQSAGGHARAKVLSPARRREISVRAAVLRWAGKRAQAQQAKEAQRG